MTTKEFIDLVEEETKDTILGINSDITADQIEVIQVWYCKTIQNHKGLFIMKNIVNNKIYPYFIEATYNGDRKELYLDYYTKQLKHTIDCIDYN